VAIRAELLLATSNSGKVREFSALASGDGRGFRVSALAGFAGLAEFAEDFPTFAENAAGKALHYSRLPDGMILADDSGLVVPALGGAPGVHSARYAGPGASSAERMAKLLGEMQDLGGRERAARFVCVLAVARSGRAVAVASDYVEGIILEEPRGSSGFGYDPVFLYAPLGLTFAEIPSEEKNKLSHRGRAFRKLLEYLSADG
jgi:XTP/dITP diphosphohydrolase